jgi:hypothetical protein
MSEQQKVDEAFRYEPRMNSELFMRRDLSSVTSRNWGHDVSYV